MNTLFADTQNPILWTYTVLILAAMGVGAIALLVLGPWLKKDISSAWDSYKGWLIMVPAVLAALWLGRTAIIVGLSILSLLGFREFARATGLHRHWWFTGVVYLAVFCLGLLELMEDPRTGMPGWYGLFMATPVFVIATLLTIPVFQNRVKGQLQLVSLSIVGFIYMGWMFGHLAFLANSFDFYGYVLFLVFAVQLNDVSAFAFGKAFGKHPLRSEVSPNKTIEGSLGAFAVSMALPWIFHFTFPHFGWPELVLTGLIVGIGGQLGDLTISMIKRDLGRKDMGALIPGHGGILDRMDSLIFVAPLFFHMVRWFHDIY
ncbi:MAG: phosphatidate cytidylyltransferase [Rhodothermales bacterium]|jgi:phosphatidate cytidylyltransferase